MKVSELVSKTFDKIIVYKRVGDDYIDIFSGNKDMIPVDILNMDIYFFGCKRKGVLDIQVIV